MFLYRFHREIPRATKMKSPAIRIPNRTQQYGAATVFTAVMLTLITGLGVLYLTRGAVSEVRTIANSAAAQESLINAESAISNAFQELAASPQTTLYAFITNRASRNAGGIPNLSEFRFCSITNASKTARAIFEECGTNGGGIAPTDTTALLAGRGSSSIDQTARRYVVTTVSVNPTGDSSYRPGALAPLTLAGASGALTGNATVVNNNNNLTIWTGKSIAEISGSFDTRTIINGVPDSLSSDNTSGRSYHIGPDVVTNDYNLRSLVNGADKAGLERLALGRTFEEFKTRADIVIDLAEVSFSSKIPDIVAQVALGAGPVSVAVFDSRQNVIPEINIGSNLGTTTSPIILATTGNVKFGGNTTVNGLVYAGGTVDFKGGGTLTGTVVADSLQGPPGKGNFTITHGPSTMWEAIENEFNQNFSKAIQTGTWRDW